MMRLSVFVMVMQAEVLARLGDARRAAQPWRLYPARWLTEAKWIYESLTEFILPFFSRLDP